MVRICSVSGCQNIHKGRGFCDKHLAKEVFTDSKLCTLDDCNNKHSGRGYCDKHLQRLRKWGDVNFVPDPKIANAKRAKSSKGRKVSQETRQKISKANSNPSKETRKKLSESHKGKRVPKIVKQKISISLTGRKLTKEHAEKSRIGLTGLKRSPVQRKNMSKGRMGMKFSIEHKENLAKHRLTQKFPKQDTKLEIAAQTILRDNNIKFIDHKAILGQPDIFIEPNFCIFMDGDYFHGNPDMYEDDYVIWKAYDKGNIHRPKVTAKSKREKDHKINLKLKSQGYRVMRTYETPFYDNPKKWLTEVKEFIKNA
ncbi:MAG: hypothetical protein HN756_03505 [Nitrosopumilus sp.]|nr:hypothetical protein [Nitrosopumilus sp.]